MDCNTEALKDFDVKNINEVLENFYVKNTDEALKDFNDGNIDEILKHSDDENDDETLNPEVLEDDLKILCYELYNYFMARCYSYSDYPQLIYITESSEFTEELGKAVATTWHKVGKKYLEMLHNDYPRYIHRIDNFKTYVLDRVKEITNESVGQAEQIITITVFLFEVYIFCVVNHQYNFLPNFFDCWYELCSFTFCDKIKKRRWWKNMRKVWMSISKSYDRENFEKEVRNSVSHIQIKMEYFIKDAVIGPFSDPKEVSRFHILNEEFEKILPPHYPNKFRNREETLNIISTSNIPNELYEILKCTKDNKKYIFPFIRPFLLKIADENDEYKQKKPVHKYQRKKKNF